jgi:hypothetical protein
MQTVPNHIQMDAVQYRITVYSTCEYTGNSRSCFKTFSCNRIQWKDKRPHIYIFAKTNRSGTAAHSSNFSVHTLDSCTHHRSAYSVNYVERTCWQSPTCLPEPFSLYLTVPCKAKGFWKTKSFLILYYLTMNFEPIGSEIKMDIQA